MDAAVARMPEPSKISMNFRRFINTSGTRQYGLVSVSDFKIRLRGHVRPLMKPVPCCGSILKIMSMVTVAALYERRRCSKLEIVGGHRPPLQFKLTHYQYLCLLRSIYPLPIKTQRSPGG